LKNLVVGEEAATARAAALLGSAYFGSERIEKQRPFSGGSAWFSLFWICLVLLGSAYFAGIYQLIVTTEKQQRPFSGHEPK
jgi:hypothetical protein